jgi:hypothetical protein
VGAHPSLGERIAEECLNRSINNNKNNSECELLHQLLGPTMSDIVSIQKQIHNPCGAEMRSDFMVAHASGQKRIIEVKTVVDTDYSSAFPPPTTDVKATTAKTAAKKKKGDKIKCLRLRKERKKAGSVKRENKQLEGWLWRMIDTPKTTKEKRVRVLIIIDGDTRTGGYKHRCFALVLLSSTPVHLCSAVRARL